MENTIVIQDRFFLFASAFFRVDNTEWVNNHELIYEDNEDEIVNRFNFKLERGWVKILQFFKFIFETVYQFCTKRCSRKQMDAKLKAITRGLKARSGGAIVLFEGSSKRSIKNYNGFYSGRGGGLGNQPNEDEDIWVRLRRFLSTFLTAKVSDNQEETYYPKRMYRGNSLD